jgi:exoribonuclease R
MTGMAAAKLMLDGGVGILRTMPPPDEQSIDWFRRRAKALGSPWAEGLGYGAYLRTLDADDPKQLAIMHAAASLFRGAGYTAFDGETPSDAEQAAVAAPNGHATAPLRRLVDRFTLTVCEALANGREIPGWARQALPGLPAIMAASDGLAGRLDRAAIGAVEAAVLSTRIGETFPATVLAVKDGGGSIQLDGLAVTANCEGSLVAGDAVSVRLVTADVATGTVLFRTA